MNYVVFTQKFMPADDPQAYSATRFLSALAESGHNVHVVTTTTEGNVPDYVVGQILSAKIKITRIRTGQTSLLQKMRNLIRDFRKRFQKWNHAADVLWEDYGYEDIRSQLINVLRATPDPILIVRSFPPLSAIVAYKVAKYATRFIVHFSDPYPFPMIWGNYGIHIKRQLEMGMKILESADAVTVTCPEAIRAFVGDYAKAGYSVDTSKFHVVPHIGEPPIVPSNINFFFKSSEFTLVHSGSLNDCRYARELVEELTAYHGVCGGLALIQLGQNETMLQKGLETGGVSFVSVSSNDPSQATSFMHHADAILIVDTKTYFDFSPFIPSKFAYAVYTDTPIIAYTLNDSPMSRLKRTYPEAGIFLADPSQRGSLCTTLGEVVKSAGQRFERKGIRSHFSKNAALEAFQKVFD